MHHGRAIRWTSWLIVALLAASATAQPARAVDKNSTPDAATAVKHKKKANKENTAGTKMPASTQTGGSPNVGYDPNNGY